MDPVEPLGMEGKTPVDHRSVIPERRSVARITCPQLHHLRFEQVGWILEKAAPAPSRTLNAAPRCARSRAYASPMPLAGELTAQ